MDTARDTFEPEKGRRNANGRQGKAVALVFPPHVSLSGFVEPLGASSLTEWGGDGEIIEGSPRGRDTRRVRECVPACRE